MSCTCKDCNTKLKSSPKRQNSFFCPKCKCSYAIIVVKRTTECVEKDRKAYQKT